jgi:DNA invertase Pin-like site-specific DNA recombinase
MTVAGYIFQVEHDADVPDQNHQQTDLQSYAALLGVSIDIFYIEMGISIKRPFHKRDTGARILDELTEGDMLLTGRAEWVLSSAKDGLGLITLLAEKGVALYCQDLDGNLSTPEKRKLVVSEGKAEFTQKLLASLAVCEGSRHGEAIKAAKRQMAREGKYIGGPVPFGWQVKNGVLRKDREQQKIINQIKRWRSDRWSYRDIAVKLRKNLGVKLSHEGIRKVLLNSAAREGKKTGSGYPKF